MFSKSILRSLVDGGTQLSDETALIDRLEEFAQSTATNKQLALFGGIGQVGAGLLFAPMYPIAFLAVGLGAYCLTKMQSSTLSNTDDRELRFLSKHRNIFSVLKRLELQGVGTEDILQGYEAMIARYNFATDQIILSPDHVIAASNAISGFETVAAQIQNPDDSPPSSQPKRSFLSESLQPRSPQIGANTRFNALPVPSQTVTAPTHQTTAIGFQPQPVATETRQPLPVFNPVDYLIGDRLRTSLIVSVSGGGKDMLLLNALRKFLEIYPGFSAIVMDCKDDPKEYGYYSDLPRTNVYWLNLAVSSDSTIAAWVDAILDDFNTRPEKVLLVCNEGTLVREKSKRYVDAIASLVSSGDSRQKYCWEAGQSGHTDDLKVNGAARSRFRPMVICMTGEEMQVEAILRAKWLADSANDMQACRAELRRSPVGRAWSDGQRWYPMPTLENFAGYDRDSRSFLNKAPSETPSEVSDMGELAIRAEIKRFLLANPDGSKPRDLAARARKPVKGMPTEEIKLYLEVMSLEGEVYEVDGTYFKNSSNNQHHSLIVDSLPICPSHS